MLDVPPDRKRQMLEFVRPYRGQFVAALGIAAVSAGSAAATLFILQALLEPIMSGTVTSPWDSALVYQARIHWLTHTAPEFLRPALAPIVEIAAAIEVTWARLPPMKRLGAACGGFLLLTLVQAGTRYIQRLWMRSMSLGIVASIRSALFDRLMDLSMRFFHANHSSKLLSRITHDLSKLGSLLVDITVTVFVDIFKVIGTLAALYFIAGKFIVIGLVVAAMCFYPTMRLARRVRSREHKNRAQMGSMFQTLTESLSAQKIVKVFGAEEYERQRFEVINAKYTEGRMRATELKARTGPIVDIVGGLGTVGLMYAGGVYVLSGGMTPETLMVMILGLTQVVTTIRHVAATNNKLQEGLASADRVATVLYSDSEIHDAPDAIELPLLSERIVFENVNYSHTPDTPVLEDINFELFRGQTLALVGPTGAGKSTIGDLIVRLYDVDSGAVMIDGVDVRDATLASLRGQVAMVTQDTVLFQDTIANNIAYGAPDTPREDIIKAATAAHAHEFISEMDNGYETLVGERGARLSGGQRQRIAIARALLKDAPILVLDEATSALDSHSEALVQDAIDHLREGRTTITIAHRLSTIRDADQILVLEAGRVVQRGTHAQLLDDTDGLYAHLYAIQSRH